MRLVRVVRVERRRVGEGAFFFLGGMMDDDAAAVCSAADDGSVRCSNRCVAPFYGAVV